MNYRSIADLSRTIHNNLHKLPKDIDLVVGIPRSGLLAANMIALALNLRLTDLNAYIANTEVGYGERRRTRFPQVRFPSEAKHVLIVDDSVSSGDSLKSVRSRVGSSAKSAVTYCAVYTSIESIDKIDIYFERVAMPRLFEWNIMHRSSLSRCCVDLDGVLCIDPTRQQNDDGPAYEKFMRDALPLANPSHPAGHIVTSRLEKYRLQTEEWLFEQGIKYGELHMLDLPDGATRRKLKCHGQFKADVYGQLKNTILFIESEPKQAIEIVKRTNKPVLCYKTQKMYNPGYFDASSKNAKVRLVGRGLSWIRRHIS